jgi:hypothetical protein
MRHIYCHLWPVRLYHIPPHFLINDTMFHYDCCRNYELILERLYLDSLYSKHQHTDASFTINIVKYIIVTRAWILLNFLNLLN